MPHMLYKKINDSFQPIIQKAFDELKEKGCSIYHVGDFSKEDFTDESLSWLTFVQRRVSESLEVNNRLQSRVYFGYNPSLKMQDSLTGAMYGHRISSTGRFPVPG